MKITCRAPFPNDCQLLQNKISHTVMMKTSSQEFALSKQEARATYIS